jgi:gamma-glutamyltranspeptidase/glutathione hydrolase
MVILSVLEHLSNLGSDPKNIVALPRYHHQYLPDRVQIEPESFDQSWISSLEALGHNVQVYRRKWGNMQAIYCEKYTYKCVTLNDPRGKAGVVF